MSSLTPDGLTFAVADLHGRADLLSDALAAIDTYAPDGATIVFLGDYVDRGRDGAKVLETLRRGPRPGWRWICLKGNHEAMMSLALRNPERLDWWLGNGGDATVASYRDHRDLVSTHLGWIEALPTLHVDPCRVFVHAGVERAVPLAAQQDKTLLWKRYPPGDPGGHRAADGTERHVVHGHDPDENGPLLLASRTALDTLAWRTGRLCVGVFDNQRSGGPVDKLTIRRSA